MKCPKCDNGKLMAFFPVYAPDYIGERKVTLEVNCDFCDGTAEISDQQWEWMQEGAAMRLARITAGVGLRQEAERRGMTPSDLSYMEQGKIEPNRGDR